MPNYDDRRHQTRFSFLRRMERLDERWSVSGFGKNARNFLARNGKGRRVNIDISRALKVPWNVGHGGTRVKEREREGNNSSSKSDKFWFSTPIIDRSQLPICFRSICPSDKNALNGHQQIKHFHFGPGVTYYYIYILRFSPFCVSIYLVFPKNADRSLWFVLFFLEAISSSRSDARGDRDSKLNYPFWKKSNILPY